MNEEKSLANIAQTAYWTKSENQDTFDRVATAVEAEVLKRLNKSEVEPVGGQELSFVQVAQWVEKHESTKGLQWQDSSGEWRDDDVDSICANIYYRVAPKKVNDPDDHATWEKGVAILCRDSEDDAWILGTFTGYVDRLQFKYCTTYEEYKYAKLATPEQVEAWKLINDDL